MAAPQLNFPKTANRFIIVNYQSNTYLNEELDGQAKQVIARVLVEKINGILNIHSYVHGQIIIEVSDTNVLTILKAVVNELAKPMASHTPKLLYSVDLASKSGNNPPFENWIYVYGDDKMNENFLKSIVEFYPKKDEKKKG